MNSVGNNTPGAIDDCGKFVRVWCPKRYALPIHGWIFSFAWPFIAKTIFENWILIFTLPLVPSPVARRRGRRTAPSLPGEGGAAGPGVGLQDLIEGGPGHHLVRRHGAPDGFGDLREIDFPVQERLDVTVLKRTRQMF